MPERDEPPVEQPRARTSKPRSPGRKRWPEEIETIDTNTRVCGVIRELAGWRVVVLDVPPTVLKKYLVKHHEPDIRQIAEAKLAYDLVWTDPDWEERR